MQNLDNALDDAARRFADLSDAERLDHAAVMARSFRKVVDGIRAGNLDAPAAAYERFAGAAEALEAITAGRFMLSPAPAPDAEPVAAAGDVKEES